MRSAFRAVCLAIATFAATTDAKGQDRAETVITIVDAPIYVVPDPSRTPLRVARRDSVLRLLKREEDWCLIEFEDPQWGRRVGYVQAIHLRPAESAPSALEPVDVSVREGQSVVPAAPSPGPKPAGPHRLQVIGSRLSAGTKLVLYDDLKNRRRLSLTAVSADAFHGHDIDRRGRKGPPIAVPFTEIGRLDEERSDGLGRGAGIGAAVGGGLALIGAAGCTEIYGYEPGECAMAAVLVYALPGIAIGALIDWSIKEKVTLYEAPTGTTRTVGIVPLFAGKGAGVGVHVRF